VQHDVRRVVDEYRGGKADHSEAEPRSKVDREEERRHDQCNDEPRYDTQNWAQEREVLAGENNRHGQAGKNAEESQGQLWG